MHWLIPDVTDLLIEPHLQRQRGSLRLNIATCTYSSAKQNEAAPQLYLRLKILIIVAGQDFKHKNRSDTLTGLMREDLLPGYRKAKLVMDYHSPPYTPRENTGILCSVFAGSSPSIYNRASLSVGAAIFRRRSASEPFVKFRN